MSNRNSTIHEITPYIYGTTRLGDKSIPREERIKVALAAMDAGVWFHTSRMYDDALEILGEAFAAEPTKIPKLIVKIGWDNIAQLRGVIEENLTPLGQDSIQLGQLCLGGELAEDFSRGGDCYRVFQDLKDEGLVGNYVVEAFPWTSESPLAALRAGYTDNLIEGFIFYLNPLQRFASNPLWGEIIKRKIPIVAMRTVSGGPVHSLRDVPGFAWKDYLQKRAVEVAPIFEESGIENWTEFCVRFAHSIPQVVATVGSSSKLKHLNEFLQAKDRLTPLPDKIMQQILALHQKWSDELDIHAEPWSM